MNYLLISFIMVLLPLNLGWTSLYILKFIGGLFGCFSVKEMYQLVCIHSQRQGIAEPVAAFKNRYEKVRKILFVSAFVLAVCAFVKQFADGRTLCFVLGSAAVLVSLAAAVFQLDFVKFNEDFNEISGLRLLGDFTPFHKAQKHFKAYTLLTFANLVCDGLNRFGSKGISYIGGVAAAVSKLAMFIVLICLVLDINKMRVKSELE